MGNKIQEAIDILKQLGLPKAQQNERSALTLLALLDLNKETPWSKATRKLMRIHDILEFIRKNYNKKYAENTRETIRRQTLHQFEQAGIVIKNPDDHTRPTNSPKTVYAITKEALEVIKRYGTEEWDKYLKEFMENRETLVEKYKKIRARHSIAVKIDNNVTLNFSPGKHNELQAKILTELKMKFFPEAKLVYVGDTARKMLYIDNNLLKKLNIRLTEHDKLPDVIYYDEDRNLLILIEAVTSHGPISPKRKIELEEMLKSCKAERVYISAFPDFKEFKRHIEEIAWETEIWISDFQDHMIHFNGPKFLQIIDQQRKQR